MCPCVCWGFSFQLIAKVNTKCGRCSTIYIPDGLQSWGREEPLYYLVIMYFYGGRIDGGWRVEGGGTLGHLTADKADISTSLPF